MVTGTITAISQSDLDKIIGLTAEIKRLEKEKEKCTDA